MRLIGSKVKQSHNNGLRGRENNLFMPLNAIRFIFFKLTMTQYEDIALSIMFFFVTQLHLLNHLFHIQIK